MAMPSQTPMAGMRMGVPPAMRTPCLDGIGNLIQIHVAGDDLAVGGNDADQRAVQLLRRVAQRIRQAAVWGPLRAFFDVIAVHRFSPFSTHGTSRGEACLALNLAAEIR